jgi:hydroxymethylpyrimidine/phosphomethylpyrimidine kinase
VIPQRLRVLTIGPSDSSGTTGIQADLRVFEALGVSGLCAVTAVMASDGKTTRRAFIVPPRTVEAQIDAVARGGVDATKIAGLYDRTLVDAIAERVRRRRLRPVLIEPGIVNAKGERVLGRSSVEWLRRRLLPQTALVVLDPVEAEIVAGESIDLYDSGSVRRALEQVRRSGAASVLLRPSAGAEGVGWFLDEAGLRALEGAMPRETGHRDRFTAAATVRLATGDTVERALVFAGEFVDGQTSNGRCHG